MEQGILASVALTILLLGAALLVVWSRRDIPRFRGISIPLALVAALIGTGAIASTLGHAVPYIRGLTAPAGEVPVLSVKLLVDKGIYITLDLPDEPKLIWLPWDVELAEKLQEMMSNGGAMASLPQFEWSWDINPPSFNGLPPPKWLPDKPQDARPQAPHFNA